jgi:hypothetical protein
MERTLGKMRLLVSPLLPLLLLQPQLRMEMAQLLRLPLLLLLLQITRIKTKMERVLLQRKGKGRLPQKLLLLRVS